MSLKSRGNNTDGFYEIFRLPIAITKTVLPFKMVVAAGHEEILSFGMTLQHM